MASRKLTNLFDRLSRAQSKKDREIVAVRILSKRGAGRALVELPGCDGETVVAREPDPIACGSSAQAIVNRATGAVTILPGPASEPGQAAVFASRVRGSEAVQLVPLPTQPMPMRFLARNGSTTSTTVDVHEGTLDLGSDPPAATFGDLTIEASPSSSINLGGVAPAGGLWPWMKLWPLPDGGGLLGLNSFAATVETTVGNVDTGGQSELKVWDSATSTVSYHTSATGVRFHQPVADGGSWWWTEYPVDVAGPEKLMRAPIDLSTGAVEVSNNSGSSVTPRWGLWVTSSDVWSPVYRSSSLAPNQAWKYPRNGGTPTLETFAPLQYAFRCPSQSAFPISGLATSFHAHQYGIAPGTDLDWTDLNTSTGAEFELTAFDLGAQVAASQTACTLFYPHSSFAGWYLAYEAEGGTGSGDAQILRFVEGDSVPLTFDARPVFPEVAWAVRP